MKIYQRKKPRRDSEGQFDNKGVKGVLETANAMAERLSDCFALLVFAEDVGEILSLSLLLVAGKVRGAISAWCKQTVLNQIDKSGVRKSGGPNSIHPRAL